MYVSHQKEEFSRAFVLAIAAQVGCKHGQESVDDNSVDMTLTMDNISNCLLSSVDLKIQLKCTSQHLEKDNVLAFSLSKKNYDDLRASNVMTPRILIVLCVPDQVEDWIIQDSEKLCMFRCAYWHSLLNSPEIDTKSTTVHIPLTQRFDAAFLKSAMLKIASGECL